MNESSLLKQLQAYLFIIFKYNLRLNIFLIEFFSHPIENITARHLRKIKRFYIERNRCKHIMQTQREAVN